MPFLKLRSFTADKRLVQPIVMQSLDACLLRCHLRDFSVHAVNAAFCEALQRFTNLQELTLTPDEDQGALSERVVTAVAQLPKLHTLELPIAPSAAQLRPPSLTALTVVFAKLGCSCCEYVRKLYKTFPAIYGSPPASSSSSSSADVADFSHLTSLQQIHTQATDYGGYNMLRFPYKVCTIKLPHFVGTVDVRHPARLQAVPKPPAATQQQQGQVQCPPQHGTAQGAPAAAAAAAAAPAGQTCTQKVQASCIMLDIPKPEHAVVMQDLHWDALDAVCLRLGTCGMRYHMFPDSVYSRAQSEQYLQEAAAALGRCSSLSTLILHVSIQPDPRLVGSIPWCDSSTKLRRLQQLDITTQWLPKEDIVELTVLTALTHLGLDVKVDEHTATTLLAQLPCLQSLYLNCSAMQSAAVLEVLATLTSLQCLQLMDWGQGDYEVRMQNSQVLRLSKLKQLRKLQLPLLQHCSPVALGLLKAVMPQLEELSMNRYREFWNHPCMEIW